MNPMRMRDFARRVVSEKESRQGMAVDRLSHVLGRLQEASGLDVRQPVLLREDEDGLFALLPEERGGDEFALCTCWCLNDKEACAAYPGRSVAFSRKVCDKDAMKILSFLHDKGYTNLWVANNLTESMHTKRLQS